MRDKHPAPWPTLGITTVNREPKPAVARYLPPSRRRRRRRGSATSDRRKRFIVGICLACLGFAAIAAWDRFTAPVGEDRQGPIAACSAWHRSTCLIDGDTGRDGGRKWRLISIDTPELSGPLVTTSGAWPARRASACNSSWPDGYRIRPNGKIDPHGRALVDIELPDGRDVSRILLDEGLAQRWPNRGNVWCEGKAAATRRAASGDRR